LTSPGKATPQQWESFGVQYDTLHRGDLVIHVRSLPVTAEPLVSATLRLGVVDPATSVRLPSNLQAEQIVIPLAPP
ncbi:MAG TPA: hypothetical protein VMP08_05090, partial [Anaerolineae bacterium]|nr:hypothetical protein [Anaerolineae bacterium]